MYNIIGHRFMYCNVLMFIIFIILCHFMMYRKGGQKNLI